MADQTVDPADTHEEDQDELRRIESKIADQLSTLSMTHPTPEGSPTPQETFDPDEVDFDSSQWLLQALRVQIWLRLAEEISLEMAASAPEATASKLFQSFGSGGETKNFELTTDGIKLTLDGAERFSNRLDVSARLAERFSELVEDLTIRQATAQWVELWEEEENVEPSVNPIRAKTDVWRIQEFPGKATKGKLNLNPSYQRGDVWKTPDSQKLIDSILRGIPLPSVIILKPKGANVAFEVVDGKQRLTSILRFIGQHPVALAKVGHADAQYPDVDFKRLFHHDYKKFRRLWKTHVGEKLTGTKEDEYYFPFPLARNGKGVTEPLSGKYYYEIRDELVFVGEEQDTVQEIFEGASDYKIPVIIYQDAAPRQVHEVFHLYNRQGKHLNAEEIRNAIYHDIDLMKLLLVLSGDNSNLRELASYIPENLKPEVLELSKMLTDYRFGTSRYKRTKLLSWVAALLFEPALQDDEELLVRSTAKHIDALFDRLREEQGVGQRNRLLETDGLIQLVEDLSSAVEAHSAAAACWSPKFKDLKDGGKWQELQLVASLVGVFLASLVDEDVLDRLEERQEDLLDFTESHLRPNNAQNVTQWGFIGKVSLGILESLQIAQSSATEAMQARFGQSCIPTLVAAQQHYKPRK